jgi:hypothetical protein
MELRPPEFNGSQWTWLHNHIPPSGVMNMVDEKRHGYNLDKSCFIETDEEKSSFPRSCSCSSNLSNHLLFVTCTRRRVSKHK